jgi:hypothetical protein
MRSENNFIYDIEHTHICGQADTYCGHPRQGGIFNFGNNEIAFMHWHAPCDYATLQSVSHEHYPQRGQTLLMRSLDGGETWPQGEVTVVFDNSASLENRRAMLQSPEPRRKIDLSSPGTMYHFGQTRLGPSIHQQEDVCFFIRSSDKGKTWEKNASFLPKPIGQSQAFTMNHPKIRMPDGTYLTGATIKPANIVALYGTEDNGENWEYLAKIADDPTGMGRPTYDCLLYLPNGILQCYTVNIQGLRNAIQLQESLDGGYSWSQPRPIVRWGNSPWVSRPLRPLGQYHLGERVLYRSPWPMILRDGRILVVFARRTPPLGIGAILSEDGGKTWSQEAILRDDATSSDIGYPVCTELEDGRVFAAYYFVTEIGGVYGGPRFIAGTHFRVR